MNTVTTKTHANIALIKYWGKRDPQLMLPARSSLAINLEKLATTTHISFALGADEIELYNGTSPLPTTQCKAISAFLSQVRTKFDIDAHFRIRSVNQFPTASGLASSASGFAALALGVNKLCGLGLDNKKLSQLAQQGSGSAARSVRGGWVLWQAGGQDDGSDCWAEQVAPAKAIPGLRTVIALIGTQEKKISSRLGMEISKQTSPSYASWTAAAGDRIAALRDALSEQDFLSIGRITEDDWDGMHTVMRSSQPMLEYWTDDSYAVMAKVKELRRQGISCFFTTDAGPHVIVLTLADDAELIATQLRKIAGVTDVLVSEVAGDPIID